MTDRLQALLSDAAAGAREYADAEGALRSARRRRSAAVAASLAAVALVAGAVVILRAWVTDPTPRPR